MDILYHASSSSTPGHSESILILADSDYMRFTLIYLEDHLIVEHASYDFSRSCFDSLDHFYDFIETRINAVYGCFDRGLSDFVLIDKLPF